MQSTELRGKGFGNAGPYNHCSVHLMTVALVRVTLLYCNRWIQ